MKKKMLSMVLAMAMALSLTACGSNEAADASSEYVVGICNYVDDASLNQICDNIQNRLAEIGTEKGVTFTVKYDNCMADANVMEQIISDFIADDVDLMVSFLFCLIVFYYI